MVLQDTMAVLAVAIALGADAFSVALGMGVSGIDTRFKARFIAVVALLHVIMPLTGLQLGLTAGKFLGMWAAWLGALVLVYVGYEMISKGRKNVESYSFRAARESLFGNEARVLTRYSGIIATGVLGVSVSVDALTVGFSLGTARVPIPFTVAVMGATAGLMTAAGFLSGKYLSKAVGQWAQLIGGVILFLLAVKMVL